MRKRSFVWLKEALCFYFCVLVFFISSCGGDAAKVGLSARPSNTTCLADNFFTKNLSIENAFPGLEFEFPISVNQDPLSGAFYVVEQNGLVKKVTYDSDSGFIATIFLDLRDEVYGVNDTYNWEFGLYSLVFHPNFLVNRRVFLTYVEDPQDGDVCGDFVLAEYQVNPDFKTVDTSTKLEIFRVTPSCFYFRDWPKKVSFHQGGRIQFDENGYLILGLGDLSDYEASQDLFSFSGKFLRFDIDSGIPYAIPPENPFFAGGALPEIYAYGFRNPWQWTYDLVENELWVGDVGSALWEEVNLLVEGGNHGWPLSEGSACFVEDCDALNFVEPFHFYSHEEGCAITMGPIYRGNKFPELYGKLLFGDFCTGHFYSLDKNEGKMSVEFLGNLPNAFSLASFGEDKNNEVYLVDRSGKIYKLVNFFNQETLPEKLSETGCFENKDPTIPAKGLISYEVNVPFWSDGAIKRRWFALPDEAKVRIDDQGEWEMPIGSVLIKELEKNGIKLETRFFVHLPEIGWKGFSYEWNVDGSEAFLVPSIGSIVALEDEVDWEIPSRSQCLRCHTQASGRVLGLENIQLNRSKLFDSTGIYANQLSTYNHIGLFENNYDNDILTYQSLPDFSKIEIADLAEVDLEVLAKAYLHTNCSMCHRPDGTALGFEDFRYKTPFSEMNLCNVVPATTDFDLENARLIVPGDLEKSILWRRFYILDYRKMPPLGKDLIDPLGADILKRWIESLKACS